jgi:DNA-binding IclR family transcriptional regulator
LNYRKSRISFWFPEILRCAVRPVNPARRQWKGSLTLKIAKQKPLERYLTILETIAASRDGLVAADIAGHSGLPAATTHRLLQSLRRTGMVNNEAGRSKSFRIGERLFRLVHSGQDTAWLKIAVQPILVSVAEELAETCFLTRLVGSNIVSLAWAIPGNGQTGYVVPGSVMPPHAAASAKAVLAFQPADLQNAALAGPLPQLTQETKTGKTEIKREYASVRRLGYATCWNEIEIGLGAIAVPIVVPGLGTIYSLAVSGLAERITRRPIESTVLLLRERASALIPILRNHSA